MRKLINWNKLSIIVKDFLKLTKWKIILLVFFAWSSMGFFYNFSPHSISIGDFHTSPRFVYLPLFIYLLFSLPVTTLVGNFKYFIRSPGEYVYIQILEPIVWIIYFYILVSLILYFEKKLRTKGNKRNWHKGMIIGVIIGAIFSFLNLLLHVQSTTNSFLNSLSLYFVAILALGLFSSLYYKFKETKNILLLGISVIVLLATIVIFIYTIFINFILFIVG